MFKINPIKLYGSWNDGIALDSHTVSSVFIGYDEFENARFDTIRSHVGELVYQLKYKNEYSCADELASLAVSFLKNWHAIDCIDTIIPAPYSIKRSVQPVYMIAQKISAALNKNFYDNILLKTSLGSAKNQNKNILIKAISNNELPKAVLLIDDIFETGST